MNIVDVSHDLKMKRFIIFIKRSTLGPAETPHAAQRDASASSPPKYSANGSVSATAWPGHRAEGPMLKHEGRATDVLGAAFRRRGADSECLGGLLEPSMRDDLPRPAWPRGGL